MISVVLDHPADWDGFRTATRALILSGVGPNEIVWSAITADDLFAGRSALPKVSGTFNVPRPLVDLAETAIQASDPERFALLYRLIHRAHAGERTILEMTTDPDVVRATRLAQAVRRDTHKMRAFLRFREVMEDGVARYVAWFEPSHHIVDANAPFFARRFATMTWSILTPGRSAHWDGETLRCGPGARPEDVPDDDALEAYWRTYFAAIFNPARLKVGAMTSEMPKKYWRNLPEAAAIPDLIRGAAARTEAMMTKEATPDRPARPYTPPLPPAPEAGTLAATARAAADCKRCPLWEPATQIVFGEGPADAAIMLVGEQPGDQEDLIGRPFVGPAGQMLDRALAEAGIDRRSLYVTNAVKHFKFEPRGKRRIHAKPETPEILACRFWLDVERAQVSAKLIVALGATAARSVLDRAVTISRERSRPIRLGDQTAFVTIHPSYLLRLPDEASRAREYAAFVADLRAAAALAPTLVRGLSDR